MAKFHKGFVYETDVSHRLMIEGVVLERFDAGTSDADSVAEQYIDEVLLDRRDMIRAEHLEILNKGVAEWNRWRQMFPYVRPTLAYAKAEDFKEKNLQGCDFSYTNLCHARLPPDIHLEGASFHQAILACADLREAHLEGANFCRTDLYETDLTGAWLTNANLQGCNWRRPNSPAPTFTAVRCTACQHGISQKRLRRRIGCASPTPLPPNGARILKVK